MADTSDSQIQKDLNQIKAILVAQNNFLENLAELLGDTFAKYILKSAPPLDVGVKISAETTSERLENSIDNSLSVKPHSMFTSIFAPQFVQFVIDFDPKEAFFFPNSEENNPEISKSKYRFIFNGINYKFYNYGRYDDDGNFKKNETVYISRDNLQLGGIDYSKIYMGKFFFPAELPFFYSHEPSESKSILDVLSAASLFEDEGFKKCKIMRSGDEIKLISDVGPYYECVFAADPIMLKSCKRVYTSDDEIYTVSYEFSGEIALPWNGVKIPNKFVRTSFSTKDNKGHRETAVLKSIEIVKNFDIRDYDKAPDKGWTVYDRVKGISYKIGDTKEDILKSIIEADKK